MAQNSTNIPGVNGGGMYNRGNAAAPAHGGTVVPGMHEQAPSVESPSVQRKLSPVVGFLYSISRKGIGEYWPVCIGQNTIGRDASNDVVLGEATVSTRHAVLNVKQLKQSKKLVAQIRDEGSKNGITVNEDELDFGNFECHNGDVIRIGDNYQLLLILIDAEQCGLSIAEEFLSTDDIPAPPAFAMGGVENTMTPYSPSNRAINGTQAMDGSVDFENGGTKFL